MANDYDRILKENIGRIFLSLSQKFLGINILQAKDLVGKLHKTLEREPDFVKIVTTDQGEEFILHLEFQLQNDLQMLRRMRTYHALLEERHRLPVRQFVFYMGRNRPTMKTRFEEHEVMSGFDLFDIHRIDVNLFLQSDIPEEIILAILADFKDRNPEAVIRFIVNRLKKTTLDEQHFQRLIQQLGILSRISKLEMRVKATLKEMPITIDITQDAFFIEGMEKGMEKGIEKEKEAIALKMLQSGTLSLEAISNFTGLSIERLKALK